MKSKSKLVLKIPELLDLESVQKSKSKLVLKIPELLDLESVQKSCGEFICNYQIS